MPEHTPGPWITVETRGPCAPDQRGDKAIVAEFGQIIAEVFHRVGPDDWAPVEANARLIAAAPDLLAAAELVYKYLEEDPPTDDAPFDAWESWRTSITVLRAAIAKARGKEALRGA